MGESQSSTLLTMPALGTGFTPEILENEETYLFQCHHAGVFQCSITGLAFGMEGEGEVRYRTVTWDRRLLAKDGKRPAGPLFNIDCPQNRVCQLHFPHCQIHAIGGCDFLSVAHVMDGGLEFIAPTMVTDTHVIINITELSGYGNVQDEKAPILPINARVVLFYQPPLANETRSILNVLLLPSNVDIAEVQRERKMRNGDKDMYIESASNCKLTPNKDYTLSTDPDNHTIKPKKAEFNTFDSYQNYIPTFRLLFQTLVKEVDLGLKELDGTDLVWDDLVFLPASTGDGAPSASTARNTSTGVLVSDQLLDVLEELGEKDLKKFKRFLCRPVMENFEPLRKGPLENCDEEDTVDLIVQKFRDEGAKTLTQAILRKMGKNDLADSLS